MVYIETQLDDSVSLKVVKTMPLSLRVSETPNQKKLYLDHMLLKSEQFLARQSIEEFEFIL
jgi:hypothetical protein